MNIIWGIVVTIISLIGWLGQIIALFSPKLAVKFGVTEPETDVDPTFYADVRGEALWDTMTLWTLPAAGILLILDSQWWVYFGLVGGAMYLYFAGRGIVTRLAMQRRSISIGKPGTLKIVYLFLTIWGIIGILTIIMAVTAMPLK